MGLPRKAKPESMTSGNSRADQQARDLLEKAGVSQPPIPVDAVADFLGLQVLRSDLGGDVSGVLVVDDDHGVIGVNETHALVRQRFTIAHEIGHFVLHRGQLPLFIDTQKKQFTAVFRDGDSATGENKREVEANRFAASLLMPLELVRRELGAIDPELEEDEIVASLAERFKVSKAAMSFRLANLSTHAAR